MLVTCNEHLLSLIYCLMFGVWFVFGHLCCFVVLFLICCLVLRLVVDCVGVACFRCFRCLRCLGVGVCALGGFAYGLGLLFPVMVTAFPWVFCGGVVSCNYGEHWCLWLVYVYFCGWVAGNLIVVDFGLIMCCLMVQLFVVVLVGSSYLVVYFGGLFSYFGPVYLVWANYGFGLVFRRWWFWCLICAMGLFVLVLSCGCCVDFVSFTV